MNSALIRKMIIIGLLFLSSLLFSQGHQRQIYPAQIDQTEISIAINPISTNVIMAICNGNFIKDENGNIKNRLVPCYITTDGGVNWINRTPAKKHFTKRCIFINFDF